MTNQLQEKIRRKEVNANVDCIELEINFSIVSSSNITISLIPKRVSRNIYVG